VPPKSFVDQGALKHNLRRCHGRGASFTDGPIPALRRNLQRAEFSTGIRNSRTPLRTQHVQRYLMRLTSMID